MFLFLSYQNWCQRPCVAITLALQHGWGNAIVVLQIETTNGTVWLPHCKCWGAGRHLAQKPLSHKGRLLSSRLPCKCCVSDCHWPVVLAKNGYLPLHFWDQLTVTETTITHMHFVTQRILVCKWNRKPWIQETTKNGKLNACLQIIRSKYGRENKGLTCTAHIEIGMRASWRSTWI